jgi:type I restriction enzyme R subunit
LTDDELAFYDALETNDSAVAVLGDETLRTIARELVLAVRRNTTIDWAEKESVRAKVRLMVKRILKRYGYPPDRQEKASRTVLEQAEVLSATWGVEPPTSKPRVPETLEYPMPRQPREHPAVAEPRDGADEAPS